MQGDQWRICSAPPKGKEAVPIHSWRSSAELAFREWRRYLAKHRGVKFVLQKWQVMAGRGTWVTKQYN